MVEISDSNLSRQQFDLFELLQAVVQKDRLAFERLYDTTVQHIYRLAYRITLKPELAEEVVNDVYLQVWQQADRYNSAGQLL